MVPKAYQQRFRAHRKTDRQTVVEFAREKESMFDSWSFTEGYDTATAQSCRPIAAAALLARPFKRPGDGDAPGPPAGAGGLLSTPCFTESVLKSLFTAPAAPSPAAVPPKPPAGVPERFADALWETRRAGRGMQPVANEDEACKHDPPSAPLRD
ncbi:hypothetical protein AOLI_G00177940 [Acnodon oligacanthus]